MNKKYKNYFILTLFISVFLISSFKTIPNIQAIDDNYSTYLFNQDINVQKDSAHLFQDNSDGSNSYRNSFQSDFLFPAKLQSNMLSTGLTSQFTTYSFNQYYFDNLDNLYNYQSNDNSKNTESSIVSDNFNVINGTNIVNGSLEKQDSEFGKYNATYTFDEYQETESNYGNYDGTYSFENEIGLTNTDISLIDYVSGNGHYSEVKSEILNHKSVLESQSNLNLSMAYIYNYVNDIYDFDMEFWFANNNSQGGYLQFKDDSVNIIKLHWNNEKIFLFNTTYLQISTFIPNTFYHIRLNFDSTNEIITSYINGNESGNMDYENSMIDGIDSISFMIEAYQKIWIDGLGYTFDTNYNENDNTNPYGVQTELENDNFTIDYSYDNSICINNVNNYGNILNLTDLSSNSYISTQLEFNENEIYSGYIDLSIRTNNTSKISEIIITDINDKTTFIHLKIIDNKFSFFNFKYNNWYNITEIYPNSNQWYNIHIYFDSILCYYNLSINNIRMAQYEFVDFSKFNYLYLQTNENDNNYEFLIDNIDFSWTNGYYENRITDLIPLNDSNYNMYKSEVETLNMENINLFPNNDIVDNWQSEPIGNHYETINDIDIDFDYIKGESSFGFEQFGFSDLENQFESYLFNITITIRARGTGGGTSLLMTETYYLGNTYYKNHFITDSGSFSNYNFNLINFNYSSINDIEIQLYTNALTQDYISSIYISFDNIQSNAIKIITETSLEYNESGKPVINTLYFDLCSNEINYIDISIYNYDIENYYQIKFYQDNLTFNDYSFIFNESAYYRFNKFKLKIESFYSFNFNLFIDKLSLNITYITQNNAGYIELIHYNYRYDNTDAEIGYNRLEFQIYNNSIRYRYSEINYNTDDYIYAWITYDISNIAVNNIELQTHVRFGLNTLDIEIINVYYQIWINYDTMIEFREQSRKDLTGIKLKSSFNFTSFNRNYLNLTGIIGNYSYNSFAGMRSLYGSVSEIFHRYFLIPFFSDDIDVTIDIDTDYGSISNPDEPDFPSETYWTYVTFKTQYHGKIPMNIGNWSIDFAQMEMVQYTAKYPYKSESISRDDLGSWKWKIKFTDSFSYTVDFNFMRNAVKTVINTILLLWQLINYLCIAGASYLFMYIGCSILVFIWNTMLYWIFYALIYVFWWIYEGLYLLIAGLMWLYETVIEPFLIWIRDYLLPIIVEFVIYWMSIGITFMIYIITLGQIDFWSTQAIVYDILWIIVIELYNWIITFTNNMEYILLFTIWYLLCVIYLYLRYLIARGRGYKENAERYYYTLTFFIIPIKILFDWIKELLGITPYF